MSAAAAGGTIVINSTPSRHSSMALDYEMGLVRVTGSSAAFSSSTTGFRVRPNDVTMIAPSTPTKIVRSCPSTPTGLKTVQGSLTSIVSKLNNKRSKIEMDDSTVSVDGKPLSEHDYSGGSGISPDSHARLRNLLVAQLDLIKRQSDAIITKDRQLRELRQENRALQQRLLNLGQTSNANAGIEIKKGIELKTSAPIPAKSKIYPSMTIITKDKAVETTSELLDNYIKWKKSYDSSSSIVQPETNGQKCKSVEPIQKETLHLNSNLETDKPYYTFQGEEFLRSEEKEIKEILSQAEVPGWRIVSVPTCYSMEGTENIEDETVLKRHNKPEMDEKRRKRWDLQRLRQQRQVERLRARYDSADPTNPSNHLRSSLKKTHGTNKTSNKVIIQTTENTTLQTNNLPPANNSNNTSNINSYCGGVNIKETDWLYTLQPLPELATHIQVSEKLPVNAFGFCVPMFQKQDFTLPWLVESTNDKTCFRSKSTCPIKPIKSVKHSSISVCSTQRGVKKAKGMKAASQKINRSNNGQLNGSTVH